MNYESQLDLNLQSAEWAVVETTRLITEHKKCRTENCKALIEKKLRAIQGKLNHESRIINQIVKEAKDEGFEL